MFQTKEKDKVPELSEVEISNLHTEEFEVIIIKMIRVRRRIKSEKLKVLVTVKSLLFGESNFQQEAGEGSL